MMSTDRCHGHTTRRAWCGPPLSSKLTRDDTSSTRRYLPFWLLTASPVLRSPKTASGPSIFCFLTQSRRQARYNVLNNRRSAAQHAGKEILLRCLATKPHPLQHTPSAPDRNLLIQSTSYKE
ncbi:hypothetical protein GDO81_027180 [Engystomops pustulosus]|uniref:Uncharacterized protein n=1 Tax=Engystomops pustulosus TaxID=76066 RepID=A0AAV6YK88_ENGPU|nr:hypothetical protein GDO81_027180 [Engystomops pustulosus]